MLVVVMYCTSQEIGWEDRLRNEMSSPSQLNSVLLGCSVWWTVLCVCALVSGVIVAIDRRRVRGFNPPVLQTLIFFEWISALNFNVCANFKHLDIWPQLF